LTVFKAWPTEKEKKKQFRLAVVATLVAVMDGVVMVLMDNPLMILLEMGLVFCAVVQWIIYFNTQTLIDLRKILSDQRLDDQNGHNAIDAGDS
jgi:hypothetical protein